MKLEDIEITFGKSVCIEKSVNPDFVKLTHSLCKDVEGSFLHCNLTSTGWVTIIRYSKLKTDVSDNYCLLRIILIKKESNEPVTLSERYLRGFLYEHSHKQQSSLSINGGVRIIDSCPIICHKELLSITIKHHINNIGEACINDNYVYKLLLNNCITEFEYPFAFCDRFSDCVSLYGEDCVSSKSLLKFISPNMSKEGFKNLEKNVNKWKVKLKRKGRRALKKNLTLEPI